MKAAGYGDKCTNNQVSKQRKTRLQCVEHMQVPLFQRIKWVTVNDNVRNT
jgi:hypothetical protein